jgi:hypothetical protein
VQSSLSVESKKIPVKSMREENKFLSLLRFDGKFLSASTKGQLISKGHFGVFKSTKKPTKLFKDFCLSL